jgi:hypothetical protein
MRMPSSRTVSAVIGSARSEVWMRTMPASRSRLSCRARTRSRFVAWLLIGISGFFTGPGQRAARDKRADRGSTNPRTRHWGRRCPQARVVGAHQDSFFAPVHQIARPTCPNRHLRFTSDELCSFGHPAVRDDLLTRRRKVGQPDSVPLAAEHRVNASEVDRDAGTHRFLVLTSRACWPGRPTSAFAVPIARHAFSRRGKALQ